MTERPLTPGMLATLKWAARDGPLTKRCMGPPLRSRVRALVDRGLLVWSEDSRYVYATDAGRKMVDTPVKR